MGVLSLTNVNKRSPISFLRFKRFINIGLVPIVVVTLKGLWVGNDTQLNRVLVIITITIPGLMEAIGMLLADDPIKVDTENVEKIEP